MRPVNFQPQPMNQNQFPTNSFQGNSSLAQGASLFMQNNSNNFGTPGMGFGGPGMNQDGMFGSPQGSQQFINPDDFAQVYADINGLSLEDAKNELKNTYGDPQTPTDYFSNNTLWEQNTVGFQNPDDLAQEYADENGISLEEAIDILKELYGDPQQN